MVDLTSLRNPFRDNVVQDAWQSPADVGEIHDDVFRECLAGIDSASRGIADSLVIFGPAGSGKTHLLTRVQRHLVETAGTAPDRVLRCVFVFVRLQTSPALIWQHVRRRLANDLMRRDQGVTQLQRLIAHQMSARNERSPRTSVMELRVLNQADQDTLCAHLDEVALDLNLPRDLGVVLQHLVCNRSVRDASAWLAGESLPDTVLTNLNVGPEAAEDREEAAREIVVSLCRLAGETLPIVFCFDQVEALQHGLDAREAFYRFGRMTSELFDADANVFLITCLQSAYLESFRDSIRQADRDRMARRQTVLEPLVQHQVEKLLISRLRLVPELGGAGSSSLYPFTPELIADVARETPCVPRAVLAKADRAFEAAQHGWIAPRPSPERYLHQELEARVERALRTSTPAETTRILLQGLEPMAMLPTVRGVQRDVAGADFLIEGEQRVAATIRNESDGRSLAPRLKKLVGALPRSDGARSVIVRDPRLTISSAAVKTREHLAQLGEQGVALVEPTVEALAALAALAELLADAKSGDLANDGTPIGDGAVLDWIRSLHADLLLEPVGALVDSLLGGGVAADAGADDATERDLSALLATERAMALEAASKRLGVPKQHLIAVARRRSDRFLLLEGPPEALIDVAGVVAEVGA